MPIRFEPLPADWVAAIRAGGPDANGQPAERMVSDGDGNSCRYCLCHTPKGEEMLILAARPFPDPQPYAETGPIFMCAECARFEGPGIPLIVRDKSAYIVRGYKSDNRILYGTGKVVTANDLPGYCEDLLTSPDIAYLHVRSATNNCYQVKVVRDDGGDT